MVASAIATYGFSGCLMIIAMLLTEICKSKSASDINRPIHTVAGTNTLRICKIVQNVNIPNYRSDRLTFLVFIPIWRWNILKGPFGMTSIFVFSFVMK